MYRRRILANGTSIIRAASRSGPPWISHSDPDFLRWMGQQGYSTIDEIPPEEDYRGPERCERCGERGVDLHHTAPKEWFGAEEAERWPIQHLCPTCHRTWHEAAERAAVKLSIRLAKGKGLYRLAAKMEEGLTQEPKKPNPQLSPSAGTPSRW
jgi:hypothetical protein